MKQATSGLSIVVLVLLSGSLSAQSTEPIEAEAFIDAAPEAVWAAWTTSEGLRAWLTPHAETELRIGGLMRANYNARGSLGDPATIENVILSFHPSTMLSIQVTKAPEGLPFPTAIKEMWTVIYFEPAGEGRTRIRVVGLGFGPDDESQQMRTFFERGNQATLRQLQRHFSKVPG